jgi:purine-cytosine permease-like protein
LIVTFISLVGYNVVATVLVAEGLHDLWAVNRPAASVGIALVAASLAIWGYDWLHRVFRMLFWISLPLFTVLTLAIVSGRAGGVVAPTGGWHWAAFVTQLASAASFNVTAAPYVSDYSRYLPSRTPRGAIIFHVFMGSALSAIWLIAVGAWLATHMGATDGLIALKVSGDAIAPGLGLTLAATSIAALVATIGMNAYITTLDSIRPVKPTSQLRVFGIAGVALLWIAVAVPFGGNAVTGVNALLVIMLYFLMPWTAVNLIDYFLLRRGRYSLRDLFTPDGIYGAWGTRGLIAYAVGIAASVPFFVVPNVYTGPVAARIGGVDIGWLVSLVAASLAYLWLSRDFDRTKEAADAAGRNEDLTSLSSAYRTVS